MAETFKSRLITVDYLKFLAVLLIIIDHSLEKTIGFLWSLWIVGAVGVSLFVFVSGFLAETSNKSKLFSLKQYMTRRFAKLFPLYLLASVLMFGFHNSTVSLEVMLGNIVFVNSLFWFVPLILVLYLLFGLSKVKRELFVLGVSGYVFSCLVKAVLSVIWGDYQSIVMCGYWVFLLWLFFKGASVKTVSWKLPKLFLVEFVSSYSYPIYLLQAVFIGCVLNIGASIGLLYVCLAFIVWLGLSRQVNKTCP
jgi:hypothetical protein